MSLIQRLEKLEVTRAKPEPLPLFVYYDKFGDNNGIEHGEPLGDYCQRVGRPLPLPEQDMIHCRYVDEISTG